MSLNYDCLCLIRNFCDNETIGKLSYTCKTMLQYPHQFMNVEEYIKQWSPNGIYERLIALIYEEYFNTFQLNENDLNTFNKRIKNKIDISRDSRIITLYNGRGNRMERFNVYNFKHMNYIFNIIQNSLYVKSDKKYFKLHEPIFDTKMLKYGDKRIYFNHICISICNKSISNYHI